MSNSYQKSVEDNVYKAIAALHSERYYHFTDGLLRLLDMAKFNDRLLQSLLSGAAGVPRAESERRLQEANRNNDWY